MGSRAQVLATLRQYLGEQPPGPIADQVTLLEVLQPAWRELSGSEDWAMAAHKLDRIEDPRWNPPHLTFQIERHGAVVVGGSTRAELQSWMIDVDSGHVDAEVTGHRQIRPMSKRVDVVPLAREIVTLVISGADHECLSWSKTHTKVRVKVGQVIPSVGPKQTIAGRRKRLREALRVEMDSAGWREVPGTSPYTYESAPTRRRLATRSLPAIVSLRRMRDHNRSAGRASGRGRGDGRLDFSLRPRVG
jgi:hypothetical protein